MATKLFVKKIGDTGEIAFEPDKWSDNGGPDANGTTTYTPSAPPAQVSVRRPPLADQDHTCVAGTKIVVLASGVCVLKVVTA